MDVLEPAFIRYFLQKNFTITPRQAEYVVNYVPNNE